MLPHVRDRNAGTGKVFGPILPPFEKNQGRSVCIRFAEMATPPTSHPVDGHTVSINHEIRSGASSHLIKPIE